MPMIDVYATAGTFPTGTPLFGGLLLGVVIIVVGLTYFPVVALGPVVEHLVGRLPDLYREFTGRFPTKT